MDDNRTQTLARALGEADFEVPKAFRGRGALAAMRAGLWVPIGCDGPTVLVAAAHPEREGLAQEAATALGASDVAVLPAAREAIARILDNSADVCPGFPPEAGRVELAKVRTYLAARRSFLAGFRTTLARGRTGLSMFRTGIAFLTVVLVLLRIFGLGPALPFEALLCGAGLFFIVDGILWYLPARRMSHRGLPACVPEPDPELGNTGVLAVSADLRWPRFRWLPAVPGAQALRAAWELLSPVARRRFLAMDRTALALERTTLAELRSIMARSRTGLALGRTGIAVAGVGIAMIRQFHHGPWDVASFGLIGVGAVMALEGLSWYLPARRAGRLCHAAMCRAAACPSPRTLDRPDAACALGQEDACDGLYGTTGLALVRTVLAEERNVLARLRTQMARGRTGLSFIRTGLNAVAVGLGLLAWFGTASTGWTVFNLCLSGTGVALLADGLYWYLPAAAERRRSGLCTDDFELAVPDYAAPESSWGRASAGLGGSHGA